MEREKTYTKAVSALLQDFRQTHDLQLFLDNLRGIEQDVSKGELWLRFFEGDTGATSIHDLEHFLSSPSHPNYKSVLRSIDIALKEASLQVHFS